MKLDGDEDSVEKDEYNNEPIEHLRLDDVTNSEPSVISDRAQLQSVIHPTINNNFTMELCHDCGLLSLSCLSEA